MNILIEANQRRQKENVSFSLTIFIELNWLINQSTEQFIKLLLLISLPFHRNQMHSLY